MTTKPKPPALGAPVKASGYMVRYSTYKTWREGLERDNPPYGETDATIDKGARGWKRTACPFEGVYIGRRVLKIRWWWHTNVGTFEEDHKGKVAAYITVWLVAYSDRARPRYVLPRDVEAAP